MLLTSSFALAFESQNLASFVAQFPALHFKKSVGVPPCSTPSYLDFKLQRRDREKRENAMTLVFTREKHHAEFSTRKEYFQV